MYNHTYSNTNNKVFISTHIIVSIPWYKYKYNCMKYFQILFDVV